MSEYTATREGFQRAMEWSLTGPSEEAIRYCEGTSTPDFVHVMNGITSLFETYTKGIADWRAKVSDYKPVVHEFLRDGDYLAARMTGTIVVEGAASKFESFMFAKIDSGTGKMVHLHERSIWGPADGPFEHGTK